MKFDLCEIFLIPESSEGCRSVTLQGSWPPEIICPQIFRVRPILASRIFYNFCNPFPLVTFFVVSIVRLSQNFRPTLIKKWHYQCQLAYWRWSQKKCLEIAVLLLLPSGWQQFHRLKSSKEFLLIFLNETKMFKTTKRWSCKDVLNNIWKVVNNWKYFFTRIHPLNKTSWRTIVEESTLYNFKI